MAVTKQMCTDHVSVKVCTDPALSLVLELKYTPAEFSIVLHEEFILEFRIFGLVSVGGL